MKATPHKSTRLTKPQRQILEFCVKEWLETTTPGQATVRTAATFGITGADVPAFIQRAVEAGHYAHEFGPGIPGDPDHPFSFSVVLGPLPIPEPVTTLPGLPQPRARSILQ